MRTIERTGHFKRDYKREAKGRRAKVLANCCMTSYPHWPQISHCLPKIAIMRLAAIGPITVTAILSLIY